MSESSPSPAKVHARQILVLLAHPSLHRSRVNRRLAQAAGELDGIEVHDLYEAYPDADILVKVEQEKVARADVIVFLFPFYWYSTPPILKLWQDLVLEYGWAYGHGATALRGKLFLAALTTGGGAEAYNAVGFNRFTIRQLLAPLEQTAYLCGLRFLPPFVIHSTHRLNNDEISGYAADLTAILLGLRDGNLNAQDFDGEQHINCPALLARMRPHP